MPIILNNPVFADCEELMVPGPGTPQTMAGRRDYVRRFRVKVLIKGLSNYAVTLCPGLPIGGSFYLSSDGNGDPLAVLMQKTARPQTEDDWQYWIVECMYSTEVGVLNDPAITADHPEMETAKIEWDEDEIMYYNWFKDRKGVPLLTSSKMPFSPPMGFPLPYPVLTLRRCELNFDHHWADAYSYSLNADMFLGYPPGCVQCMKPKAVQHWRGVLPYWEVSYRLKFSPMIWMPKTPRILIRTEPSTAIEVLTYPPDQTWPPNPAGNFNPSFTTIPGGTPSSLRTFDPSILGLAGTMLPINEGKGTGTTTFAGGGLGTYNTSPVSDIAGIYAAGGGILPANDVGAPPWLWKVADNLFLLGWQPLVLDASVYRLAPWPPDENPTMVGPPPPEIAAGMPVPILRDGLPVSHPDLLDGSGQPVKKDANGFRQPVYLGFIIYRYMSFTQLVQQGIGGGN